MTSLSLLAGRTVDTALLIGINVLYPFYNYTPSIQHIHSSSGADPDGVGVVVGEGGELQVAI